MRWIICKSLGVISCLCLQNGKSPWEWKKANVVPVVKKTNMQDLKNCHPISLLSVSSKMFERSLYGSMFKFFTENSLIFQNQSGFKPDDSCTNQLLSITSLLNCVPCVPKTCSRANVPCVLTCPRANVFCVLTC